MFLDSKELPLTQYSSVSLSLWASSSLYGLTCFTTFQPFFQRENKLNFFDYLGIIFKGGETSQPIEAD